MERAASCLTMPRSASWSCERAAWPVLSANTDTRTARSGIYTYKSRCPSHTQELSVSLCHVPRPLARASPAPRGAPRCADDPQCRPAASRAPTSKPPSLARPSRDMHTLVRRPPRTQVVERAPSACSRMVSVGRSPLTMPAIGFRMTGAEAFWRTMPFEKRKCEKKQRAAAARWSPSTSSARSAAVAARAVDRDAGTPAVEPAVAGAMMRARGASTTRLGR